MAQQKKDFYVPKKDRRLPTKLDFSRANRIPWTNKQKDLIHKLTRKQKFDLDEHEESGQDIIKPVDTKCAFISGCAGTSKTLTAVYCALKLLDEGSIEKIIYVRSTVGSSPNSVGYIKGDLAQKTGVYAHPLVEKLSEILPPDQVNLLQEAGFVSMESTEFMRGRSLHNVALIADESQNYTWDELVTITSRMAEKSRLWFCYDPKQSDLGRKHKNDMVRFAEVFNDDPLEQKLNGVIHFGFTRDDIVRSGFCKYVIEKIEEYEEKFRVKKQPKEIPEYEDEEWTLEINEETS